MALTKAKVREILSEAGVDADHMTAAVGAIIDGHTASINALREDRETAQAETERIKQENSRLAGELEKAKADAAEAASKAKADAEQASNTAKAALEKANADADGRVQEKTDELSAVQKELEELKAKYQTAETAIKDLTKVQKEYTDYKAAQEAKVTTASKEAAYTDLLRDMSLSEKGISLALKYANLDAVELNDKGKISNGAALRKAVAEDWGDYIQQETTTGADTATPPVTGATGGKTAAEILAISDESERMAAIEANPAAFGLA